MFDGSNVTLESLPSLLAGRTLFSEKRLVVVKRLSENTQVWGILPEWLERMDDDVTLVLVEDKLDKRTTTYKWLRRHADIRESASWTGRDIGKAEEWARAEAKRLGFSLTHALAKVLVGRTGPDQWRIFHSLEKLALADDLNEAVIHQVADVNPEENVFGLLETALKGDVARVREQIGHLRQTEDAYRVSSLLASQIIQLAALAFSDQPTAIVAKDIGAHPFVLSKLAPYARKMGRNRARVLLEKAARMDKDMKSTSIDPWILVEKLLLEIASN